MVELNSSAGSKAAPPLRAQDNAVNASQLEHVISSSPRPFVLVNERELSVLRRGLTKDGWKRSLYLAPADRNRSVYAGAGLLSAANQWLETDIRIPERSGHYHLFFCDCGSRLSIPDPIQVCEQYACPDCGKTYSGEQYDGAVRYMQHQQLAAGVLALALVYAIEKDRAYSDKAAEIMLKYCDDYPGPHTDALNGGMMYQSLCEAVWSIPLAQAYDLIYYSRSMDEREKDRVEKQFFKPIAEGLKSVGADGNWGSWHLSAVGVIGCAIKDSTLVHYALDAFRMQIRDQLGDDGLWPESVHCYHFYPLSAFVHFAEACYRAGIDIYDWEVKPGKSLKSMFVAPLQYMYPSFRLPAANDGWYHAFLPLDLYEVAYRRWNDPMFAWALKKGYRYGEMPINEDQQENEGEFLRTSFYAFLFGRDLPGRSGTPVFYSHDFDTYGSSVLRNGDNIMVTFDHGPFLGHGHLDKLSFTLYANSELLVPDYGTPGYGSKIVGWYRDTAAHNTVVVDGQSQQAAKDFGLRRRCYGDFVQAAEAVAEDVYPGVVHNRRIIIVGDTCIVDDLLSSEQEHDYDWIIRCEGVPDVKGEYSISTEQCSSYPLINVDQAYRAEDEYMVDWKCSQGSLLLGQWNCQGESTVFQGNGPAEIANRSSSTLISRKHGQSARFFTVLAPVKEGVTAELEKDGCILKIVKGDITDYIYLRGCGHNESLFPLESDAEMAVLRMNGGVTLGMALMGGSWIKWHGDILLECPVQTDCVEISFTDRNPSIRYSSDTAGIVKIRTNARAMRVNGQRAAAGNTDGIAVLRITSQMLACDDLGVRFIS